MGTKSHMLFWEGTASDMQASHPDSMPSVSPIPEASACSSNFLNGTSGVTFKILVLERLTHKCGLKVIRFKNNVTYFVFILVWGL